MGQDRIIILDIDGVLATPPMVARATPRGFGHGRSAASRMMRPFQPRQPRVLRAQPVTFLNQILTETGAQLVVSSSWRLRGDCRPELIAAGVMDRFHGEWATDADGPTRGDEIARWLAAHKANSYVVLDDWSKGLQTHRMNMCRPTSALA